MKYYESFSDIFLNMNCYDHINQACMFEDGQMFFKKMLKIFCDFFNKIFDDLQESDFHTKYLQPLFPQFENFIICVLTVFGFRPDLDEDQLEIYFAIKK